MELIEYLKITDKTQAEFAREIGVTRSLVNNWLSGHRKPSLRVMAKIETVTDRRVAVADFYAA
jgi:transcriptional regulator with XRE-family HTH domain